MVSNWSIIASARLYVPLSPQDDVDALRQQIRSLITENTAGFDVNAGIAHQTHDDAAKLLPGATAWLFTSVHTRSYVDDAAKVQGHKGKCRYLARLLAQTLNRPVRMTIEDPPFDKVYHP